MNMFQLVSIIAATALIQGCSSTPKVIDEASFKANPVDIADSMTSTGGTGVLDDSKTVLLGDFKVYFETNMKASATNSGNRVSQKVQLAVDPKIMQEITDELYAKFVTDLKGMGYTVIEHKEIAEKNPEFQKYFNEKMKAGPVVVNDQWTELAPTGMKLDLVGQEIGASAFAGIFGDNIHKLMAKAADKMDAIRISPTFLVGFAEAETARGYKTATVTTHQGITIRPGTAWALGDDDGLKGHIRLEKPLVLTTDIGKFVEANTAGDKVRGYANALAGVFGGGTNNTNTSLLEADSAKYKEAAMKQLSLAHSILLQQAKTELD